MPSGLTMGLLYYSDRLFYLAPPSQCVSIYLTIPFAPKPCFSSLCAIWKLLNPTAPAARHDNQYRRAIKSKGMEGQKEAGGVQCHVFELLTLIVDLNYYAPWRDRCRDSSEGTRNQAKGVEFIRDLQKSVVYCVYNATEKKLFIIF